MCAIFNELLMLQQLNTSLKCSKGYRANYANVVHHSGCEPEAVLVLILLLSSTHRKQRKTVNK